MTNLELIHSVAQDIIDKHAEELIECECDEEDFCECEDMEEQDFHQMFSPETVEDFWDRETPPKGTIFTNIALFSLLFIAVSITIPITLMQNFLPLSLTYYILVTLITVIISGSRIKAYSRNLVMVCLFVTALFFNAVALLSAGAILLFKILNG